MDEFIAVVHKTVSWWHRDGLFIQSFPDCFNHFLIWTRGGQNSSRFKSGPDYLVFLSRFFSGNCLVQTKSRFESGFYLDKFYFYFEKMSRLCPDLNLVQKKKLDSIWIILKNKNESCPDWIRTRIWILSGQGIFRKKGGGPIRIKGSMDRPGNSDR